MGQENPLLLSVSNWFKRNFSDPAAVGLFFTVLFLFLFLEFFGHFFLPVLISIVLAYLLSSGVRLLQRARFPHILAVSVVFLLFIGLVIFAIFGILPLIIHQLQNLINAIPNTFTHAQGWVSDLMMRYPKIFSDQQFQRTVVFLQTESSRVGQFALKFVFALIPNVITAVLYFILVPLLLFFFLKDSHEISSWFSQFLPKNRSLVMTVWKEVNAKIGCYVRGRVIEIILVGVVSVIVFAILGMQYAILLGALVGLSVIVPYIGVVIVIIPVVAVGLMQWGLSAHFIYVMVAFAVIILLDANLLVPWLFSETMNLHPIVIILSVLVFGGIWGFWGVFFSIPLATVADVLLRAWPGSNEKAVR